jgi:hypothetical protein
LPAVGHAINIVHPSPVVVPEGYDREVNQSTWHNLHRAP